MIEVILKEPVDNLGNRGDVVKVAPGYARNYLLPRKLALLATDGNKKQIEREKVKFEAKESEERSVAEKILRVDQLGGDVEEIVLQQNRTEHRTLGLEVVRERAVTDDGVCHWRCEERNRV